MKNEVFEKPWPDEMGLSAKETTSGSAIDVVLSNQTTGCQSISQSATENTEIRQFVKRYFVNA